MGAEILTEAKARGELLPHVDPIATSRLLVGAWTGCSWWPNPCRSRWTWSPRSRRSSSSSFPTTPYPACWPGSTSRRTVPNAFFGRAGRPPPPDVTRLARSAAKWLVRAQGGSMWLRRTALAAVVVPLAVLVLGDTPVRLVAPQPAAAKPEAPGGRLGPRSSAGRTGTRTKAWSGRTRSTRVR
ncbi:hypothetical protein NKH18_24900 [Streptomyces sp. M10(2022)]